jgi:hypothetical protein
MLQMRARGFALHDGYADVLGGMYMREELEPSGPNMPQRQSLGSRLDALAADPQTGEIYETGVADGPQAAPGDRLPENAAEYGAGGIISQDEPPALVAEERAREKLYTRTTTPDQEEILLQAAREREALEADAREMAASGRREFDKWYACRTVQEHQILAPHMKNLMDAANKAGKR